MQAITIPRSVGDIINNIMCVRTVAAGTPVDYGFPAFERPS